MKRSALAAAIVIAILLGLLLVWQLRGPVLMFFLSLMLAAAARPITNYLVRGGVAGQVGVAAAYLVGLLLAGAVMVIVGGLLLADLQRAGNEFVRAYELVAQSWPHGVWSQRLFARGLPPPEALVGQITGPQAANLLQMVLGTAFSVFGTAVDLLVIVVLSIYWATDRVHFERLWLSLLPVRPRAEARDIWRAVETQVGSYIRAEMLGAAMVAVLLFGGLRLAGFAYPMLMAVAGGLAWLVPWLGGLFAVTTALVLSLPALMLTGGTAGAAMAAFASAYTAAVFIAVDWLVERRRRARARFSSLLMAIVVIGMAEAAGVLGLVVGPPIAVAVQVLFEQLMRRWVAAGSTPPATIAERLAALQERIAPDTRDSPGLMNIMERLSRLVEQTREVLPKAEQVAPPGSEG